MMAGTGYRSRQNGVPSQCASRWWSGCYSVRRAPARAGTAAMPSQWPGWRSTGLAPPPNPVRSRESEIEGAPGPPSRVGRVSRTVVGARCHGTDTGRTAQSLPTVVGMGASLGSWCGGTGVRAPGA
jgi:hypothetical protein